MHGSFIILYIMSQTTVKKCQKRKERKELKKIQGIVKCNNALLKLIEFYDCERISDAFDDMEKLFKEWLETVHADDRQNRTCFLYSMSVIKDFANLVNAIPPKMVKAMYKKAKRENLKYTE